MPFVAGSAFMVAVVVARRVKGGAPGVVVRHHARLAGLEHPGRARSGRLPGRRLLGVLTGRWLRFPGRRCCRGGGRGLIPWWAGPFVVGDNRSCGSGSPGRCSTPEPADGTRSLAGNPLAYLGYVLCLCAAAALVAIWHDRSARTARLRTAIVAVVVAGLACLALAITTGPSENPSPTRSPTRSTDGWPSLVVPPPWRRVAALLGCLAAAGGRRRCWPLAGQRRTAAAGAARRCAAAAAFVFDEPSISVVAVTPRGAPGGDRRLLVAAVPFALWALRRVVQPGDLQLDRSAWWAVGTATLALASGAAAVASRREVDAPGSLLASVAAFAVLAPVVVTGFLGWESVYPLSDLAPGVWVFWIAVGVGGAAAWAVAARPGMA